jgi:chemotaxis protein MotB
MKKKEEVIKFVFKKDKHKGHHGGAWKVAYADFVTALMALFIVLWLTSQSNQVKSAVADYFKDPGKYMGERISKSSARAIVISKGEESLEKAKENEQSRKMDVVMAVQEFRNVLHNMRLDFLDEGVKVEMADTNQMTFFEKGSAVITKEAEANLRESLKKMGVVPYPMIIEGHTDASPTGREDYTNWELSMDRANALRRIIEDMKIANVVGVRAYGSTRLTNLALPHDPSNRRVNIIVQIPKSQLKHFKTM